MVLVIIPAKEINDQRTKCDKKNESVKQRNLPKDHKISTSTTSAKGHDIPIFKMPNIYCFLWRYLLLLYCFFLFFFQINFSYFVSSWEYSCYYLHSSWHFRMLNCSSFRSCRALQSIISASLGFSLIFDIFNSVRLFPVILYLPWYISIFPET